MRLYCRYKGEVIEKDIADKLQSGLFCHHPEIKAKSNARKEISAPIFDSEDPTQDFTFTKPYEQLNSEQKQDMAVALSISFQAITFIMEKYKGLPIEHFSHLLPPKIEQLIAPTMLDRCLVESFEQGVLQYINQNPRMSMRYDTDLLATSRVKRTASNYQAHLVAHSECWQQRTLTSIIPKKLLAKVSEDQFNIYENVVYARLIDHLLQYLLGYRRRLKKILEVLDKAGTFEGQGYQHRYLKRITQDWGRAFDGEKSAEEVKQTGKQQLSFAELYIAKLRQLQAGELYRLIEQRQRIRLDLKSTNILMHDENYRKMAVLWRQWLVQRSDRKLASKQLLIQKQQWFTLYNAYCDKVLKQIIKDLGWHTQYAEVSPLPDTPFELKQSQPGRWCLSHDEQPLLQLIALCEPFNDQGFCAKAQTVVLTPQSVGQSKLDAVIELSPIALEGKEQLVKLMVKALWRWVLQGFRKPLGITLPEDIKGALTDNQAYQKGRLLKPLSCQQKQVIEQSGSNELVGALTFKHTLAQFIQRCPACGLSADEHHFTIESADYFKGSCQDKDCKTTWVYEHRTQRFVVGDGTEQHGRYAFTIGPIS